MALKLTWEIYIIYSQAYESLGTYLERYTNKVKTKTNDQSSSQTEYV